MDPDLAQCLDMLVSLYALLGLKKSRVQNARPSCEAPRVALVEFVWVGAPGHNPHAGVFVGGGAVLKGLLPIFLVEAKDMDPLQTIVW